MAKKKLPDHEPSAPAPSAKADLLWEFLKSSGLDQPRLKFDPTGILNQLRSSLLQGLTPEALERMQQILFNPPPLGVPLHSVKTPQERAAVVGVLREPAVSEIQKARRSAIRSTLATSRPGRKKR